MGTRIEFTPRIVAFLRLNLAFRSRKACASFVQPDVLSFA